MKWLPPVASVSCTSCARKVEKGGGAGQVPIHIGGMGPHIHIGMGPHIHIGMGPHIHIGMGPHIHTGMGPHIHIGMGPHIHIGMGPHIHTGMGPHIHIGMGPQAWVHTYILAWVHTSLSCHDVMYVCSLTPTFHDKQECNYRCNHEQGMQLSPTNILEGVSA